MSDDRVFGVLILTHKRSDRCHTFDLLERLGYSGPTVLVLSDDDPTIPDYVERFGEENIEVFHKEEKPDWDIGDNGGPMSVIIFARNECWRIAEERGWTHFLVLDDDYTGLTYRYPRDKTLAHGHLNGGIDELFSKTCDFLDETEALTVAYAQGGDHFSGLYGKWKHGILRKAMNTFFCRTDRPFTFTGRINEDVNTYVDKSTRGDLFLTISDLSVTQLQTQTNAGGMTDSYQEDGTYRKSFYSVMYQPSAVKVSALKSIHQRIHHRVSWNNCAPKILSPEWQKF